MKAAILAGGLRSLISEETAFTSLQGVFQESEQAFNSDLA
jgi:hypothetical protein